MSLLKEYIQLIFESKQNLINIGIPEVFASFIFQKFGNIGTLIGKWLKDYYDHGRNDKNWFLNDILRKYSSKREFYDLFQLYSAKNEEEYIQILDNLEITDYYGEKITAVDLEHEKKQLKEQLKNKFFDDLFFNYSNLITNILNGKLKDLSAYKNLSYHDALEKFESKKIFDEAPPIKQYENGWKWVDAGKRCQLVGKLMNNCGSTGVMSMDNDRTMIVLFDEHNNPHVITTYSPNYNRLSGDQGKASTKVKPEYHKYVIDLADTLGAKFDISTTKSPQLKLAYGFKKILKNIERINPETDDNPFESSEFYKLTTNDGQIWIAQGGNIFLSGEDFKKIKRKYKIETMKLLKKIFDYRMRDNKNYSKELGVQFYTFEEMKKNLLDEDPSDYHVHR